VVSSGEFLDETARFEENELARHGAGAALLLFWAGLVFEEKGAQVSIAKSVDFEFAAIEGLPQGGVLGRPRIEGSNRAAFPPERFADCIDPLEQRDFTVGGRECGQVTILGGPRHLGPSFQIHHSSAQNTPGFFARALGTSRRAALGLAIDAKVPRLIEGRFDAQDTALFVVHLDRVGLEGVFDPDAFGAFFEIADHFSFKVAPHLAVRGDAMAEKTPDLGAGKAGAGVTHQCGLNLAQGRGRPQHEVGGQFALLGCPGVL